MKVTFNIREHFEASEGITGLRLSDVRMGIDDLFETNNIPEEHELDLYELLDDQHAIALIWTTEQVRNHHGHLTEEQAWAVLKECERNYKGEEGLTWDDITEVVTELYPDPADLPVDRATRCHKVLETYTDFDTRTNLVDFLTDARHWCDRNDENFSELNHRAYEHYLEEVNSTKVKE
jgi:hypothetical protein